MARWGVNTKWIEDWALGLSLADYELLIAALAQVTRLGPALGRPLVDTVKGSRHSKMKELRPGSRGRSEIRVLFAFDSRRSAVLLVAGDKQGAWNSWYRRSIPIADRRLDEHEATIAHVDQ